MIDSFFFWLAEMDANFAQSLYLFLQRLPGALWITLQVTLGACIMASLLGFPLALAERSPVRWVSVTAKILVGIGQGIPLPPLVFLIYFTSLSLFPATPTQAATLSIGIFTMPYAAAVFRAGLRAVPEGQIEVAKAMGMPPLTLIRRVTLPISLRVVLPSLGHLAVVTLLNSSFASVIGATDITGMSRNIINANFSTTLWLVVGAVYFLIAFPVSRLLLRIEGRTNR